LVPLQASNAPDRPETLVLAAVRRVAVVVVAVGCTALTSCSISGSSNTKRDDSRTAAPADPATAHADGGASTPAATSIDPCGLLAPTDAQAVLHRSLGAGRKVSTGDLDECVYDDAGPLVVAVLRRSFTKDSFQRMIESQNSGPYVETTGTAVSVTGLGDAAYSFEKAGIVEVIKNATVISITSPSTATSTQVARAALPHVR
jgi:hypothetical protein